MRRIVVIGATGCGKSTLAKILAEKKGGVTVDLDELSWLPGWTLRATEDFRMAVDTAARAEVWAAAGNYGVVRDILWARADTVVWLDYSFFTAFSRLLGRSLRRIIDQKPCCNGNTETWRKFLSKDSIMVWLFTSFSRRRREFRGIFENPQFYPHITFLQFRTPRDTQLWLRENL